MKKSTKTQKIMNWASNKRSRNISHAVTDLGSKSEKAFMFMINRLQRNGLITYKIEGRRISIQLTQIAYYNRTVLVTN